MPPPPPPPPPGPGPPPPSFGGGSKSGGTQNRSALLGQIHQGARLKKAETNDRSAPQLAAVKSTGGGHGGSGGGHGGSGGGHGGSGGVVGNNSNGGGPAALGGLFAGGMPRLKSPGQNKVPGGAGGPALKPPGSMPNGPTKASSNDNSRFSNGGPPPPPPGTNKPPVNKLAQPAKSFNSGKPRNVGPPPPPVPSHNKASNGGTPGRLNSDAFRKFSSSSVDEESNSSQTCPTTVSPLAGGLASRTSPYQSSVPKPPVSYGGPPSSAATPPPPPVRPPPSNANRPNSMVGRPLPPPPPGDSESVVVGPARAPPPPPSRGAAPPPPPPNRGGVPPPPPQRTADSTAVGTIGRSGPPNIRPPTPRRGSSGGGLPLPPQIQPPSSSKNRSNSFGMDEFEKRFRFHTSSEFPPPEPLSNITKLFPSRSPRNTERQRPPPPQPPR